MVHKIFLNIRGYWNREYFFIAPYNVKIIFLPPIFIALNFSSYACLIISFTL